MPPRKANPNPILLSTAASKKFTPALFAQILVALTLGCSREVAARGAGIHPKTLNEWLNENEDLMVQVAQAEAKVELTDLKVIDDAIKGDDQKLAVSTARWRRERLNPASFGPASRNDMWQREQQIRELAEELRREGLQITEQQLMKELADMERKALPPGKRK